MPKSKSKTSTSTGPISPEPIVPNPIAGLSPKTRWILSRQIDEHLAALEHTAQELMSVKRLLTYPVPVTSGPDTPAEQSPAAPANAPARKRGRPPGSKNKPKSAEAPVDPVNPTQPTLEGMFQQAVDATRPEMDKESEAA